MAEIARPTRSATLSQQVADELRTRIVSGDWPVGTKIPAEPELIEALGVSRSTVREAVRSLAHIRMLETRAGDGTYVRSASTLEFPMLDRVANSDIRDVIEVRAMLEQRTARLAAQRCTPADAEQLRELLANAENSAMQANSIEDLLPAGLALYKRMSAIAGNRLLAELYQYLSTTPIGDSAITLDADFAPRWRALLTDMIDAICTNDPARAEHAAYRLQLAVAPVVISTDIS